MHEPGTRYAYNQMAFQALEPILTQASGESISELTDRELWGPLGFESETFWWAKGFEWPPGSGEPGPPTDPIVYGGMTTSCRDVARFCHLWLHEGQWAAGHRVFDRAFYRKGIERGARPVAASYHWTAGPNHAAYGAFDQMCSFNPENGVVTTRLGGVGNNDEGGTSRAFIDMVMGALAEPSDRGSYNATAHRAQFEAAAAREKGVEQAANTAHVSNNSTREL
jgi:CubicO group peptidase (beta-lactamase class C family)